MQFCANLLRSFEVVRAEESVVDTLTVEQRSALMARVRGVDTKPELFVRKALYARGYRYRLHVRGLPGRPDLVFRKRRTVVFVHGCFWHRHGCKKTTHPKSRQDYWEAKFANNVARDKRNLAQLIDDGWRVFVVWECETEKDDGLLDRLAAFLGSPSVATHASDDGATAASETASDRSTRPAAAESNRSSDTE